MDIFFELLKGFQGALSVAALIYCLIGVSLGTFIGALPGIGPGAGTAILLPIAFSLEPKLALIMLAGIYYGAMYGGTITSVLMNIPGESSTVLSAFEGFKLAKQGRGGVALGIAAIGSFIAGTVCVVALTFFAPALANQALRFGPAERFALIAMAFAFVGSLTSESMGKSLVSLFLGLIAATVGQDIMVGENRLTFGTTFLLDGIDFVPVIMGFFAVAEIMSSLGSDTGEPVEEIDVRKLGRVLPNLTEMKQSIMPMTRGTIIGFITGAMPGAGATIASFLSYGVEKKYTKRPELFGNGSLDAIATTEAANNAASAGAMVPLMALAIPGSSTTAVLLSGFLMFGLQPGPQLFIQHPDIAWGLIASMYIGNVMLVIMNIVGIPFFVWAVKKSKPFMSALVITLTIAGTYSINQYERDVWLMLICGIIGYLMVRMDYPLVPALLGLILGRMGEYNFRTALRIGDGDFSLFIEKPICATLLAIAFLMLVATPLARAFKKWRAAKRAA